MNQRKTADSQYAVHLWCMAASLVQLGWLPLHLSARDRHRTFYWIDTCSPKCIDTKSDTEMSCNSWKSTSGGIVWSRAKCVARSESESTVETDKYRT
jgi:hypothetical protein